MEIDKEMTKLDVEGVIRKQDTHDLYCPNCHCCITERVILSKRKPELSEHDQEEHTNVPYSIEEEEKEEIVEDELEAQVDVEGAIENQETHDLVCPNCNSCITKRVVLRRRNDESFEQVTPENVTYVPLHGEGESGVDNISSIEEDREQDVFRCLSCFSFFIPSGDGFKLFRNFGGKQLTQTIPNPYPAKNYNFSSSFTPVHGRAIIASNSETNASSGKVTTISAPKRDDYFTKMAELDKRVAKLHEEENKKPKKVISKDVRSEYNPLHLALSNGWSNATRVHLMNKDVTELPESPDCPNLTSLSLQTNSDLTSIPVSFFELMPKLEEIDLSDTSIKSLPRSFFELVALQKLVLRNCQVFMELPAQIGQLHNLQVLDLEDTNIIQLPAEIGDLVKLTCLKVSFCQCNCDLGEETMFPEGALSKLAQLIELCIDVDPEDGRWEGDVKVVIKELVHLKKLEYLKMYVPQVELLDELTANLPFSLRRSRTGFNLKVGRHMRRVMSTTPLGAEGKSEYMKKHLRYVNGKGSIPSQIKNLLKYSEALFLDRHFSVSNLSEFGMDNMENLRYCVLGECNELQTIVQCSDDDDVDDDSYRNPVLPKLQQLIIYNMKTLTSIYNAPLKDNSLCSLKTLKLYGNVQLRTIFILESGIALVHLEEITVEDCPAVLSLITCKNQGQIGWSFPKLKKICLHYLTELQSIFSSLCSAPNLERLSVYDCPNLKTLSAQEISRVDRLRLIRGEEEWWKALEWNGSGWEDDWLQKLASVFVPIRSDADLETQLAQDQISEPDIDVERVLEKQDTHDLYCPNCNSCITKRVILRRTKREQKMARHIEGQASGIGTILKDSNSTDALSDMDVEGVIEKQDTHDLFCPNCNSCITTRVILRRRKRKLKMGRLLVEE